MHRRSDMVHRARWIDAIMVLVIPCLTALLLYYGAFTRLQQVVESSRAQMQQMADLLSKHDTAIAKQNERITAMEAQNAADRADMCEVKADLRTIADRQLQLLIKMGVHPIQPRVK